MDNQPACEPSGALEETEEIFARYRVRINDALDSALPPSDESPHGLHKAMRYSVFAGGKRLRPILVLATAQVLGRPTDSLLPAACSVELIHTYSLIHDDLPAFDDDDLRRGKPTNHKIFGVPQAILAGDALQSLSFSLLANAAREADSLEPWINSLVELSNAVGSMGMAGGQWRDIEAEDQALDVVSLGTLHSAKTGALLTACVRIGALLGGADDAMKAQLDGYGKSIGLAFQIVDDILDVEGSVEDLGKIPGADRARGKATYPGLLGLKGARAEAHRLRTIALESIEPFGAAGRPLELIANFIVDRSQ
tara:strand:- start:443 stop:1369 length:927 start_codon:yes stop_codon:yes gene_type:complete